MKKILIILALLTFPVMALADSTITLEWDASAGTNVEGYRLYQRTAATQYDFSSPTWEGPGLTCTVVVQNTDEYSWVVRAYKTSGVESGPSNEFTLDLSPPVPPVNLRANVIVVVN